MRELGFRDGENPNKCMIGEESGGSVLVVLVVLVGVVLVLVVGIAGHVAVDRLAALSG